MLTLDRLAGAMGEWLARVGCVPLLAFRVPEFERVAWRNGKREARRLERQTAGAFACAARRIVRCEDLLAHDDGSDCFAVALIAPARDGGPVRLSGVRSILERIAAAMTLATARQMEAGWCPVECSQQLNVIHATLDAALERGARERRHGRTLAIVGHELRTPLTSICGYVETLLEESVDSATARRFLETVRQQALRLGRLVDGMLEFSMLDLASNWPEAACDVAACARAAIETALPFARSRDVALHERLLQDVRARLETDLCMHAIVNLVENAVNYCGERGNVEVECARQRRFAVVTVDDDGPGIPPHNREEIFQLGVRVSKSRPGTGIGLAVVKAVADRAGGDINVTNSPLGGARFVIRFPSV